MTGSQCPDLEGPPGWRVQLLAPHRTPQEAQPVLGTVQALPELWQSQVPLSPGQFPAVAPQLELSHPRSAQGTARSPSAALRPSPALL